MLDSTLTDQTQAFLDAFGDALEKRDVARAREMFLDDCYWRDLVAFTWNIKTVEGKDQIEDMLRSQLDSAAPSGWRIAEGELPAEEDGVVTAWIQFETATGRGYGLVRLRDGKIWTLLTTLAELKGHEEPKGFAARSAPSTAPRSIARPGRRSGRPRRASSATPASPTR